MKKRPDASTFIWLFFEHSERMDYPLCGALSFQEPSPIFRGLAQLERPGACHQNRVHVLFVDFCGKAKLHAVF